MVSRTVKIQVLDQQVDEWRNLHLSEVKFHDDEFAIGGPFRILVNNDIIFSTMKEDLDDV